MTTALQACLLVGGSVALNYAFLLTRPWLALLAGLAYAAALTLKVPT